MDTPRSLLGRFWNWSPVIVVRAAFEVYGFLKTVVAIAGSSVIGALVPALVELGLSLTPLQEWIIGTGIFTVFLAAILNRLTPVVQNYSSARTQLKRLAGNLQVLEQEVKKLRADNERLTSKVIRYDGDRAMFKDLLIAAYEEGSKIRESDPSQQEAEDWKERVGELLEEAVGDWLVESILGDGAKSNRFGTTEQMWMDSRLDRLFNYAKSLETQETVPFRSSFDPHGRTWQTRD